MFVGQDFQQAAAVAVTHLRVGGQLALAEALHLFHPLHRAPHGLSHLFQHRLLSQ